MLLLELFDIHLTEAPSDDVRWAEMAQQASITVSHAIYGGLEVEHEVEIGGFGDYLVWSASLLGLTNRFPELADYAVMFGLKNPKAVGLSGGAYSFSPSILGGIRKAVIIDGLPKLTDEEARKLAGSTGFLEIAHHEFLHVFDGTRSKWMNGTTVNSKDSAKYYNHPSEFNAYYHDIVTHMTALAKAGDEIEDYADIYGFTGDFKKDLSSMLTAGSHIRQFVKWLSEPRRKALLKRIYRMHKHVCDLIATQRDAAAAA